MTTIRARMGRPAHARASFIVKRGMGSAWQAEAPLPESSERPLSPVNDSRRRNAAMGCLQVRCMSASSENARRQIGDVVVSGLG